MMLMGMVKDIIDVYLNLQVYFYVAFIGSRCIQMRIWSTGAIYGWEELCTHEGEHAATSFATWLRFMR